MSLKSTASLILAAMTLSGAALAQTAALAAPAPDWTVTGNAGLYTDYRFRGFSQTDYGPAFQGGIDLAHKSGFYLGNWNSNVSSNLFNGASLEIDLYGGYKGAITDDLGFDVGLIYYYYPKSGQGSTFNTVGTAKIDNTEVYFGLTYGPVYGKLYYAVNDYFDLAKAGGVPRSTKGTTYLDLGYSQEFSGIIVGAHLGYLTLEENRQFVDARGRVLSKSVTDYKVSVGTDVGNGYILTGAIVGTNKKEYFATGTPSTENGGKTKLVVSLSKSF
ncbi:MAG: TorF family putative porin [Burkholderiales bacterium]